VAEKLHSELGASVAERWMACPGSVRASRGLPNTTSVYAAEGTAAHALAERCLKTNSGPAAFIGASFDGIEVTEEMAEAVEVFIATVKDTDVSGMSSELMIEQSFDLASLNPPGPMYGTADAVVWLEKEKHLVVIDLKYGKGYAVDAVGNKQLRYYGLGAILSLPPGVVPDTIELVIVQPRAPHPDGIVRRETITLFDMLDFVTELMDAAVATTTPDASLVAGPHCKFCRAAPTCPALGQRALTLAQSEFDVLAPTLIDPTPPAELPLPVLLHVLENADILSNWLGSVHVYVQGLLESGQEVPGWKLVDKRATRSWGNEDDTVQWLNEQGYTAPDEMYTKKLKSPAQIEKLVGKKNLPQYLVLKKSSGVTLAPDFDTRPARMPGSEFDALPPSSLE